MRPALAILPFLAACGHVEPAPADIDGLAHWFWDHRVDATDDDLVEAVENAHAVVDADALEEPIDGTISDLTTDELDVVALNDGRDPALAAGMFMVGPIHCSMADLEPVLYALNQDDFFDYDRYEREYTSELDAYVARETPTLTWAVEIDASVLGNKYTENIDGGLRWSELAEGPHGPILVGHTVLPSPAVFTDGNGSFDQDYQLEVYWERAPSEIVHFYALWRQYDWGSGFDQDSEAAQRINLNGLADWDRDTEKICNPEE